MELLFKGWKGHVDLSLAKGTKRTLYRKNSQGANRLNQRNEVKVAESRWQSQIQNTIICYQFMYIRTCRERYHLHIDSPLLLLCYLSRNPPSCCASDGHTFGIQSLKSLTPPTVVLPQTAQKPLLQLLILCMTADHLELLGTFLWWSFFLVETKWNCLFLMTLFQKELVSPSWDTQHDPNLANLSWILSWGQ